MRNKCFRSCVRRPGRLFEIMFARAVFFLTRPDVPGSSQTVRLLEVFKTERCPQHSRVDSAGEKSIDICPPLYYLRYVAVSSGMLVSHHKCYLDCHRRCQGPYGNFGKVDDFKVIEAKTESHGKRTYRQGIVFLSRQALTVMSAVPPIAQRAPFPASVSRR